MTVSLQKLFTQEGQGFHGHKGRVGKVGGSVAREVASSPVVKQKEYHDNVRDGGMWGYSHGQSRAISSISAKRMGINGYPLVGYGEDESGFESEFTKASNNFLSAISEDEIGSEETLYHGFQNVRNIEFKTGDTFKIPLTATVGAVDSAAGYGIRLDRRDQQGQPTVFIFPEGTSMASYSKWNKEDAKEFGYKYSEAIIAGEFLVISSKIIEMDQAQHDSRPGESWHSTTMVNVIELEPISVFDTDTESWRK